MGVGKGVGKGVVKGVGKGMGERVGKVGKEGKRAAGVGKVVCRARESLVTKRREYHQNQCLDRSQDPQRDLRIQDYYL